MLDRISEIAKRIETKDYQIVPFLRGFITELKAVGINQDITDSEIMQIAEKVIRDIKAKEQSERQAWVKQRRSEAQRMTSMTRRGTTQERIENACKVLKAKSEKITIDSVANLTGISRSNVHNYYDILETSRTQG